MRRILPLSLVAAVAVGSYPVLCQSAEKASAQPGEEKTLTIGSAAPPLDIEHWLHAEETGAEPVTSFKPGHVYVVEFWATWCPPCRASIPHLAELQEKYAGEVTIVSVSDEDVATIEPFLEEQVPGLQQEDEDTEPVTFGQLTKAYQLTTDPDESVHDDYMRAAKQSGIPTSFLVGKDGRIEWIGHPMAMDEPLQQVVAGEWDREAFAQQFREQQAFSQLTETLIPLARAGKMDEALEVLSDFAEHTSSEQLRDRARALVKPVKATAFQSWVMRDQGQAAAWMREQAGGENADPELAVDMASMLVQYAQRGGRELSAELIDAAISAVEAAEGDHNSIVEALDEIKTRQEEAAAEKAAAEAAEEEADDE